VSKEEIRFRALRVIERTASGRASRLAAGGEIIAAPALRFAIGRGLGWDRIRSDWYQVSDAGDRFLFEGRGSGHGVGLCQLGADRMGKSYREILAFYYPGTVVGVTASGLSWTRMGGERVVVMSTAPARDRELVAIADRAARIVEERTGFGWDGARVQVFPTVASFRDATGEPGFVAASTRGRTIRMQPASALRGAVESTLLHEMLHVAVESRARPGLPVWFREGLVGYLKASQKSNIRIQHSKPSPPKDSDFRGPDARNAYAAAMACVEDLVSRFGEKRVLSWIGSGLPPEATLWPGTP
jgi:stage II sporulation protein D